MSRRRIIGAAAGWAGFGVALAALLALSASRSPHTAQATPLRAGRASSGGPDAAASRDARRTAAHAVALSVARPARRTPSGVRAAARSTLRLPAAFVRAATAGLALGLLLALTLPLAFGMRPLVVLSGSMEPVLKVGDVTVVERIAPRDARVGDVVTFKAPETARLTTHRLRAVRRADGGRFVFTTKGDANNSLERWTLPADGQLSRAAYRVPLVGRALLVIRTPLGWALLVALPLLVLGTQEIARIWRRAPETGDAPLAA